MINELITTQKYLLLSEKIKPDIIFDSLNHWNWDNSHLAIIHPNINSNHINMALMSNNYYDTRNYAIKKILNHKKHVDTSL